MKKILNIVLIILLAIGLLSIILWMIGAADVDLMLYVAYLYLGIASVAAIAMTAMNMGKSRNNSKLGLFVFGILAVLAVVFYFALASSAPIIGADGTSYDNVFTLKATDTMLYLTYTALGALIVVLLGGEIWKALK